MLKKFKEQLPAMVRLALPLILSQLGQMMMGLVDTFMVGKLGPVAIGSVALGSAIYFALLVPGIGLLAGLDHFISSSEGRKDSADGRRWRLQGLYMGMLVSLPVSALYFWLAHNLHLIGVPEVTAAGAKSFMLVLGYSAFPFMIFAALRQYLQSTGRSNIVFAAVLIANISNLIMNWVLIYGHLGFPAMGVSGSALSTVINRCLMAAVLFYFAFKNSPVESWKLDFDYFKRLLKLGIPSALQVLFEVGVFSLSTTLASKLDPMSLAAHSIVLNIASLTFMVPFGLSMASAIRVAFYYGEKNYQKSFDAGNVACAVAATYMFISGVCLSLGGKYLISVFTSDAIVISLAQKIVLVAALFQIADGVQVVLTGNLRGLGLTKMPALLNFIGYWVVGLPVGYWLCFYGGSKVIGLWIGLSVGLGFVAITLYILWRKKEKTWLRAV